jgi:alkylhydroperoxidase family enzyme
MGPASSVEPLALFRTLMHGPALADAMWPLGAHLLSRRSGLAIRERELVVLRVCARCGCAYEWGVHATVFGAAAGLDAAALRATWSGAPDDPALAPEDAPLLALVDELHASGRVSDLTWSALARRFDPPRLLALLVLAGWYHLIAYVANGVALAPEGWAARPEPPPDAACVVR